jgi:hypothetical protein
VPAAGDLEGNKKTNDEASLAGLTEVKRRGVAAMTSVTNAR